MRAIHDERCPACGHALYETHACEVCDWTSDKAPVFEVFILWGEKPETNTRPVRYAFATVGERNAFMRGVEEAFGWEDYRISLDGQSVDETDAEYTCPECGTYLGSDE